MQTKKERKSDRDKNNRGYDKEPGKLNIGEEVT